MLSGISSPSTPAPASAYWLSAAATLLQERRAEPRTVAAFLLGERGHWDPSRGPLAVAGRIADTARASVMLACAMTHHARGALLLTMAGVEGRDPSQLLWDLTSADLEVDVGSPWTVTGQAGTCCAPPDQDVRYVVLSRRHGHVLSVPAAAPTRGDLPPAGSAPAIAERAQGTATVSLHRAPARVHGPYSEAMLARAEVMSDLLETAAWYGALTRIADGLVAVVGDGWDGADVPTLVLAEADALLSSTWGTIREAIGLWERGSTSVLAARHLAARARTLARTSAATLLAGYVADEYEHARRDPGAAEAREELVAWIGRRPWVDDVDVVVATLRQEGPSW